MSDFKFIDLFAGIGGFHLAMSAIGGECVFASEKDTHARKSYMHNHDIDEAIFNDDITALDAYSVPGHDVLCAGFPCQPFSMAGHRQGFDDTRGTLFFDIMRIVEAKRPKVIVLENVKGLVSHDKGRTLQVIMRVLVQAGYSVQYEIMNSRYFGTVQNRQRIFIVAWLPELADFFYFPQGQECDKVLGDFLENDIDDWYYFTEKQLNHVLKRSKTKTHNYGSGGFAKISSNTFCTLTARYSSKGDIYKLFDDDGIRQATPREGLRLQGFPDSFELPVSRTQQYKQIGNSIHVGTVQALGEAIKTQLLSND